MLQSKLMALVIVLCASVALPATVAAASRTSMDLSATYEVRAKLFWGAKRLQVRSDAHIRNDSGHGIERIVFNLVPAKIRPPAGPRRVRGRGVHRQRHGERADHPGAARSHAPGRAVGGCPDLVPGVAPTRHGRPRLPVLERDPAPWSAMRWIPWVSRQVRYQTARHGDPFVTVVSPRVRVTLDSDVSVRWATSGRQVSSDGRAKTFLAEDVRDFNFTAARD